MSLLEKFAYSKKVFFTDCWQALHVLCYSSAAWLTITNFLNEQQVTNNTFCWWVCTMQCFQLIHFVASISASSIFQQKLNGFVKKCKTKLLQKWFIFAIGPWIIFFLISLVFNKKVMDRFSGKICWGQNCKNWLSYQCFTSQES